MFFKKLCKEVGGAAAPINISSRQFNEDAQLSLLNPLWGRFNEIVTFLNLSFLVLFLLIFVFSPISGTGIWTQDHTIFGRKAKTVP